MPEVPPIPERPKVPARPKRRVTQQEWKHAEVLEQAKDRGLFEVRSYEQIRSHGTSAEGDISSSRTETRTLSNATVIHFTDVGYRPRDETAPAYSVYSHYSDLGYEGSGGETEVPSCRMSTGQRHLGVESPVGSVLEFEKFDGNTKEDEEAFYQKQNFTPPVREFQPEIPERPSRVSGPLYEISNASVIRSANAASGEQVHSAASVYRKEIKLVPPEPDSHTEDILGEQYSSKGSVFSDDCVKEGTTNMKPLDVSGIDLELGTIPNSPTEELNKLLSLALKDTSKDNLADDNDPMNFDAEQGTSNTIPDASFAVTKSSLKGWLGRGDHNGQQLNIAEKHTNFSIDSGTNIANLHFPDTTLGLGEGAIDIPLIDGGTISSIGLDRSDSGEKLQPLNTPVATLDPSSASQHTEKAPNVEAPSKSALQSTLDPTVSCANKAVSATDSNGNFGALQNMLVDPINEAEDTVKPPVKQPEYGNKSDTFTEDKVGTLLEEDDGQCSPELKHIIPVLTSQKEDVNKDASVDTSPSTLIETQERNVNASPTSQSPVRTTAQHSPAKASPKGDDSEKGSNNVNLNGQKKPKRVPIVPKKPSSKIAAFQELLQRQQADQYGSKTFEDQHNSSSPTRFGGSRSNFAQNLNGLFALPGMAPGNLPPVLAKKFAPPSPSEGSSSETKSKVAPAEDTDIRTSDIRTGRAKGPRGRKLPASVANIEKVTAISNNQIFTFNTWSVVFNKSTVADVIERSKTGERENSQESAVLPDNSKNSASNVNISQNEDSNSTVIDELASDPEILECITSDL